MSLYSRFVDAIHDIFEHVLIVVFPLLFIYFVIYFSLQLNFLINLSSNYQKIKLSKEITEYRAAVDIEMSEGALSGKTF